MPSIGGQNGIPEHCHRLPLVGSHGSHIKSSEVILNRIGLVSKQWSDSSWKHRIIWDLRRSGVNSLTRHTERVILPRLEDVANDIMNLTRSSGKDERVFLLTLFTLHSTGIGKTYLLKYPPSAHLRTAVDASQWGSGGALHQGCAPARWFADPITQLTKISSQQNKSPQFNPLWEALAICVSLCVDRVMRRARISHYP